jgi:hypothetical protein
MSGRDFDAPRLPSFILSGLQEERNGHASHGSRSMVLVLTTME